MEGPELGWREYVTNVPIIIILSVGRLRTWIAGIGYKRAEHKTNVLLISSRKRAEFITITVGDQRITTSIWKWRLTTDLRLENTFRAVENVRRYDVHLPE